MGVEVEQVRQASASHSGRRLSDDLELFLSRWDDAELLPSEGAELLLAALLHDDRLHKLVSKVHHSGAQGIRFPAILDKLLEAHGTD